MTIPSLTDRQTPTINTAVRVQVNQARLHIRGAIESQKDFLKNVYVRYAELDKGGVQVAQQEHKHLERLREALGALNKVMGDI